MTTQSPDEELTLSVELPIATDTPRLGRQAIEDVLLTKLPERQLYDIKLVASELLTDAVLRGHGPVQLVVSIDGQVVTVAVCDTSRTIPRPRTCPSSTDSASRGLAVVRQLALACGADPLPNGGTRLWAQLALSSCS